MVEVSLVYECVVVRKLMPAMRDKGRTKKIVCRVGGHVITLTSSPESTGQELQQMAELQRTDTKQADLLQHTYLRSWASGSAIVSPPVLKLRQ